MCVHLLIYIFKFNWKTDYNVILYFFISHSWLWYQKQYYIYETCQKFKLVVVYFYHKLKNQTDTKDKTISWVLRKCCSHYYLNKMIINIKDIDLSLDIHTDWEKIVAVFDRPPMRMIILNQTKVWRQNGAYKIVL